MIRRSGKKIWVCEKHRSGPTVQGFATRRCWRSCVSCAAAPPAPPAPPPSPRSGLAADGAILRLPKMSASMLAAGAGAAAQRAAGTLSGVSFDWEGAAETSAAAGLSAAAADGPGADMVVSEGAAGTDRDASSGVASHAASAVATRRPRGAL